jgi:hypothetical protein
VKKSLRTAFQVYFKCNSVTDVTCSVPGLLSDVASLRKHRPASVMTRRQHQVGLQG